MYLCRIKYLLTCSHQKELESINYNRSLMIKKVFKLFLVGTTVLLASCIDDTYDLANKELVTDVKIEGNKLALPFGSFSPIVLDSMLDLGSIPMLEADSVSRAYSLSLKDSLVTRVAQKDLDVLKEVSNLSAEIDPISIPLDEIKFSLPTYEYKDTMSFAEVELTDVNIEAMNESVELPIDSLKLDPIAIKGEDHPVNIEIPKVELSPIAIPRKSQKVNFTVAEITVNGVKSTPVENEFKIGVQDIDLDNITAPKFTTTMSEMVGGDNPKISTALQMGDNIPLPLPLSATLDNTIASAGELSVEFNYPLPKEIKHFDRVEMRADADAEGALFEFKIVNPTLLSGLSRKISFGITFPANYDLVLFEDDNKKYYSLSDDNTLSVKDMPADGETTTIHFYLKEIKDLSADKYYKESADGKSLAFNDKVSYTVNYSVAGSINVPQGTTIGDLKKGLSYSIALDASFDIEEAYGTTNPVEIDFADHVLDFSFSLKDMKYVKRIDKIELDPEVSQLRFKASSDKDFGKFDIDANSKVLLSFPDEFVFADNVTLPDNVKRVGKTNDFEITSIGVFKGDKEWILPIREVQINKEVDDNGVLTLEASATIKALSGDKSGILTIGGENQLALKKSVEALCGNRNITMSAPAIELALNDVTGQTTPIDIAFSDDDIDFNISVEGDFGYIQKVDFVEFDTNKPITISSTSTKGFGDIRFQEGSCIALRFPESLVFDLQESSLPYDEKLKAFVINDLSQLKEGRWTLALKRINVDSEVEGNVFNVDSSIGVEAINAQGTPDVFYVEAGDQFSLKNMEQYFGSYGIEFALEKSDVAVAEMQVSTNNIDVKFASQKVVQKINLDKMSYVTHIGDITLKEGSNMLKFRTGLNGGGLGRFALAENSVIDFNFPSEFKLDPAKSSIPSGAEFVDSSHIRIHSLAALGDAFEWKLAVKRIVIDKDIVDEAFSEEYTISIDACDAQGKAGNLTIAAIEGLTLSEIQKVGGERRMDVSVLPCTIEIDDAQASIDDIGFDFAKQSFDFGVDIKDLDLIDEIKYISFEEGHNKIDLNISVDGTLAPFDLADNSGVKISFPKELKLNREKSKFGGLEYDDTNNALYINKIENIRNCNISLVLDSIVMNKKIEDNQFKWDGEISVAAIDRATGADCEKLFIGGHDDLRLSEVKGVMCDKLVQFDVPAAQLRIKEAVIVSETVTHEIKEEIEISIDETIAESILRVDSIGFVESVPLILKIATSGLESLDVPIALKADIALPSVFDITSGDEDVKVTDKGLSIDIVHNFKESSTIDLKLWVNKLDFTSLEGGFLALPEAENGDRKLKYDGKASVEGSVAISNTQLSSSILENDITLGIAFEMGDVVLNSFTGIYGGNIDPVTESFELGIEDGFAELEKNGLTLANTKPELMISLYNTIGVPVDIDFSIIGRDKQGNEIPSAVINPGKTLRIKPAQVDAQGALVADTTRWIFTSNETTQVPGYEVVVVKNLDSLLNELPYAIDFALVPTIVTENVVHRVDLSKPLELGGKYAISLPFDLQFAQTIDLDLGDVADIINDEANNVTLANPQLALAIHNPIAEDLVFDLSLIGKDAHGRPISTASLVFDEPFVLAAGHRNADGSITPTPTRWLFAVSDSITKEGYDTKVAPALGTLLNELPRTMDVALNAHFNTDLTTQIDYNNDLKLTCEYGILVPLQFDELRFNYTDTVPEIKLNLEDMLSDMNLSVDNIGLSLSLNLKNTLPVGLTLNLVPLDEQGHVIKGIQIGDIEIPAGDGSAIGDGKSVVGTPVELSIQCANSSVLSTLDKIAFSLDVASGNGNHALSGEQGLQISDIVLQIMCDIELGASK